MRKYLKYDSSKFPVKFHYGLSEAPRYIYRTAIEMLKEDVNGRLVEIPITSLQLPFLGNFPIVDGIYMKSPLKNLSLF